MTPHPLQVEIARLRRRAWRLAWLQAVSRFAAVVTVAVLLWAVSDYVLRYREAGLRALGLAAILVAASWAAWRFLAPMVRWRLTDVDVARRIDRRLAVADRRVASALEFVAASADEAGDVERSSARLREAVVADVGRALGGVKLDEVLDVRPTRRSVYGLLGVAAAGVLLFAAAPDAARLALARLDPSSDLAWPPRHRLAFDPLVTHLAQGDTFEARAIERGGHLPDEVWLEYADVDDRPDADVADTRTLMQPWGDAVVARRENVQRSFWYRAVGGDDTSMPWRRVTVVAPPGLAACRITVHPPAYTRWLPADSPRAIRALVGSRVAIDAKATRPLTSAAVVLESGVRIPLAVGGDGLEVTLAVDGAGGEGAAQRAAQRDAAQTAAAWEIDNSRSYRLELIARDGTQTSASRDGQWEIQPLVDLPPSVSVEQPGGVVYATDRAAIGLRVVASDDLAVGRVAIERRLRRAGRSASDAAAGGESVAAEIVELYAEPAPTAEAEGGLARWPRDDRVGPLTSSWDMSALGVAPGDVIEYEAIATDRQGTETRGGVARIFIVSREEFLERAIDQQTQIAEQLTRALELARQSQRLLAGLLIKARQSGKLDDGDTDALRAVETEHRQLARILIEPVSGVAAMCEALLADLQTNGVVLPEGNRALAEMAAEIRRLERDELGPFDRSLAEAWTAARATESSAMALAGAVGDASARQERIVAALERLHGALARWDSVRRVSREVAEIRRVEQGLMSRATELARTTLGLRVDDLPADTRAELAQLVEAQRDLRRRLDRSQSRMEKLRATLEADDPNAAGIVVDALDYLDANPIAGDLSAAADQMAGNRLAQAARTQAAAIHALAELLALLDNRPEEDPARRRERLDRAIGRTAELIGEFDRLAAAIDGVAAMSDNTGRTPAMAALDPRRENLAAVIRQVSREAIRLEAMQAAERLVRAAIGVDGLGQLVAERPAEWPDARATIRGDLVAAERFLQAQRRQAEAEQIRGRLAGLVEQVAGLIERQAMLLAESKALAQIVATASDEAWRESTTDAIARQQALADETTALATTVDVDAFAEALRAAAGEMRAAVAALPSPKGIAEALRRQQLAIERLKQIADAGKSSPSSQRPPADTPPPSVSPGDPPPTPEGPVHVIEELRLLRAMQESLNARTAALDKRIGEKGGSHADNEELAALAAEQQRITDLLRSAFVNTTPPALDDTPPDDKPDPVGPTDNRPNGVGPNGVGPNGVGPNGVGPNDDGPNDDGPPIVDPVGDAPSPLGM